MDPRVQRILDQITARLPKELSDNLMMDDPLDTQYDGINDELMKSKHLDDKAKSAIKKAAGTQKRAQIVNEKVAHQIDQWYENEIKKCIASGVLPAPDADRWIQERRRNIRDHRPKKK